MSLAVVQPHSLVLLLIVGRGNTNCIGETNPILWPLPVLQLCSRANIIWYMSQNKYDLQADHNMRHIHMQACADAAGNFFSAAFEDRCLAVAGASGGIFGLLGLFIADMVLNFETLTR